tara:strand:+ start:41 stop:616 length:576 start_codon:yes stop_codon:yes gene_type:complete
MKNSVILDLDSVVVSIAEPMRKAFARTFGKDIPVRYWDTYNLHGIYRTSMEDMFQALVEHNVLEQSEPEHRAAEGVKALRNAGYKIIACSNRSFHPLAETLTMEWLDRHEITIDGLVISTHGKCKAEACSDYGDTFDFIIDDHYDNIAQALDSGRVEKAVLIRHPWNRQFAASDRLSIHDSLYDFAITNSV